MGQPAAPIDNSGGATPEATLVEPLLPEQPNEGPAEDQQQAAEVIQVNVGSDETAWEHGEVQEVKCQNSFFAALFLLQAITLLVFGGLGVKTLITYDPESDHNNNNTANLEVNAAPTTTTEDEIYSYVPVFLLFFLATTTTIVLVSSAVLSVLLRQTGATKTMMEFGLILSNVTMVVLAICCLAVGAMSMAVFCIIGALIGICYATAVWHRIPVAAANLAVAMTAVNAHRRGLVGLGYLVTLLTVGWTCIWFLAFGEISFMDSDFMWSCNNDQDQDCQLTNGGTWILMGLLLSLYWTTQVLKNLFHTTVAGVVGTWWFSPSTNDEDEEMNEPLASQDGRENGTTSVVYDAWIRSSIYSLGSICLGSLIVALLQLLQTLTRSARQRRGRNGVAAGGLLMCMLQCIVDQLERLAEYINKWAFVYVGLYGYDFWTAGSKVYNLFRARGWTVIINDHLVARFLSLVQLLVCMLSGGISVFWGWLFVIRRMDHDEDQNADDSSLWYGFFWLGFALGILLSDVLFRTVSSAVDTIVVCFAEAPNQLSELGRGGGGRRNAAPRLKPAVANEMVLAWRKVYPNEFGN